jgi:hypothetical protein
MKKKSLECRDPIPKAIKMLVWNKYIGEEYGKGKCFCCNVTEIRQMSFHCGHILSVADGGGTTIDNLRPICQSCNSSMGTTNMIEFMKKHGLNVDNSQLENINKMDEMKTMYENRIKELEEKNMEVNSQYKKFLEKCGIKTVKEEDLLSLVNRALQFEYELIDQFIEDNYVLNTKAKKYKKVTIDEFRSAYGRYVLFMYEDDMKWNLEEGSLDRILFDNIVIEHKKIKITKNGILKGVKSKI